MNASPCQELSEESGVAVVGRGRRFPQRDDEAGLDASLASKQLALDRGEEARKGVKATRGVGSTAQRGRRPPRLFGTDCSRLGPMALQIWPSKDHSSTFSGRRGRAAAAELLNCGSGGGG